MRSTRKSAAGARVAAKPWHVYRDSEAPGVRQVPIGDEPEYEDFKLPKALEWAARAKWGAMWLEWTGTAADQNANRAEAEFAAREQLAAFEQEAVRLGYQLRHVRRGQGDRTWRFRVELAAQAFTQEPLPL